ncbi:MAG: hypothetical protein IJV50_05280 [Lachnospiraceae bacterium]|nr:hypothetical protein [Lachnospiraceae bacterium]
MRALFLVVSQRHVQYCVLENVTEVCLDTGWYPSPFKKATLYIYTMSGRVYVVEKMKFETAKKYVALMNESGCLDLTKSLDHWVYLAKSA